MEARTIRSEVDEAFELYEKVSKRAQNDRVARLLFQELWRGQRPQEPTVPRGAAREAEGSPNGSAGVDSATAKQIKLLEDLGVRIPYNLSKRHASKMLDERLGKAA